MLNLNRCNTQYAIACVLHYCLKGIFIVFPHSKRVPFSFLILFNFQGPVLPCGVAYLLYQIYFRLSSLFSDIFFGSRIFFGFELRGAEPLCPVRSDSFVILPHPSSSCQHLFSKNFRFFVFPFLHPASYLFI